MTSPVSTSDLYDERGEDLQSVAVQFQSFGAVTAFSGPVRTVLCFEDNVELRATLDSPGDGAVLVVDGGGSLARGLMGDQIAQLAVAHGWAGVVIHAAVRDRVALGSMPLGIKALGTNPRKSTKNGGGRVDVPLTIDGVVFRPGAMVFCDEDGIVVER